MKKKFKIKSIVIISAIITLLFIATATVLAITPSHNSENGNLLYEVFLKFSNKSKIIQVKAVNNIIATVNDIPIYESEFIYRIELGKIEYEYLKDSGKLTPNLEKTYQALFNETKKDAILLIAQNKLTLNLAIEKGFNISDEEIRDIQTAEKKDENSVAMKNKISNMQELFEKLGVSEDEYYRTFDYELKKEQEIVKKYLIDYMTKNKGEQNAYEKLKDELLNNAKIIYK